MEFTYQAYTHQALNIFRTFKQSSSKPFCVFNKQLFQLKITHMIFFASQFNFRFKFELQFCILFATSIQIQEIYLYLKGILNSV